MGLMGFDAGAIFTALAALALILAFALGAGKGKKKKKLKELKLGKKGQCDGIVFGKKGGKLVYSPTGGEGSVGVSSSSGTGKTAALGMPTLRAFGGSRFVIDISGDIRKNCPDIHNKLIFEPDSRKSTPYNLFAAIDGMEDENDQNEALGQLALLLIPEEPNASSASLYFTANARLILTASLIAFYHEGLDFVDICGLIVGNPYEKLFQMIDGTGNGNAIIYINPFENGNEQNISGRKGKRGEALKLFAANAKVKAAVRRPGDGEPSIEPKMIESHSIFVIVEDPKLELYSPLLNIITSQLMQYISNRAVDRESPNILLFLDECASLRIDAQMMLEALRKCRKRRCRVMLMTQNLADLDILYGHDATRALLADMRFKALLGGLFEVESQKFFAEMIGYKTDKKRSVSKSAKGGSVTESEQREYIIEPADLDRLGDNLILISPDGEGWMKLKKNFYFK